MKKSAKFISIASLINLTPFMALAAPYGNTQYTIGQCNFVGGGGLTGVLCKISSLINSAIPVLVALGVVYLVWGVVQYMIGGGEEAKKEGRDRIMYGIIGLVVIVGMWGLVKIVTNTFGIEDVAPNNYNPNYFQDLLPK